MPSSYRSRWFASIVQDHIIVPLDIRDRGTKEGFHVPSKKPLYFLKKTNCPAIIIEPEFLQSYRKTINKHKIVDFCYALINALEEI